MVFSLYKTTTPIVERVWAGGNNKSMEIFLEACLEIEVIWMEEAYGDTADVAAEVDPIPFTSRSEELRVETSSKEKGCKLGRQI